MMGFITEGIDFKRFVGTLDHHLAETVTGEHGNGWLDLPRLVCHLEPGHAGHGLIGNDHVKFFRCTMAGFGGING